MVFIALLMCGFGILHQIRGHYDQAAMSFAFAAYMETCANRKSA